MQGTKSGARPRMRPNPFWLILSLAVVAALFRLLTFAGEFLDIRNVPERADVITVLSGNDAVRLEKAAALYHAGIADSILLTNTGRTFGDYQTPYNQLQIETLEKLEVPTGAIFLSDFVAKNTGQEATAIILRMVELHAQSVIIVTDALHTRRTQIIYSDTFANTNYAVQYVGAPETRFNVRFWYLSMTGWETVAGEYARIIGYFIKRDTNIPDYPIFD